MSELARHHTGEVHGLMYMVCNQHRSASHLLREFAKIAAFAVLLVLLLAGPVALMQLSAGHGEPQSLAETQKILCNKAGAFCGGGSTGSIPTH